MTKGRLIIITAPSGTGKTSVIRRFLSIHPNTVHSISCTTRPVRPDKKDAGDYHFIDHETFEKWIGEGKLAEWTEYCGSLYGTPKGPLTKWLAEGKDILLDVEVVGGTNLKKIYGDSAVSIFLLPPSDEELKKRLSRRGTDSAGAQEARFRTAMEEMKYKDMYDHRVVNDDLERACREIEKILGY